MALHCALINCMKSIDVIYGQTLLFTITILYNLCIYACMCIDDMYAILYTPI